MVGATEGPWLVRRRLEEGQTDSRHKQRLQGAPLLEGKKEKHLMGHSSHHNLGAGARVVVAMIGLALVVSACGTSSAATQKKVFVFGTQVDAGGGGCDATQIFQIAITLNCPSAVEEGLVRFNYKKNSVDPALATSWQENVAGATDTITFNLRQGVKFTDGTPFNAAAVLFNFRRVFDKTFAENAKGKFPYTNYVPFKSI